MGADGRVQADDYPHGSHVDDVLTTLDVDPDTGLSATEARTRQDRHGRNELAHARTASAARILIQQFRSTVVVLLIAAVIAGLAIGEYVEAAAIAIVLIVNATVGFVTELRAVRSIEALRSLASSIADVERDDRRDEVDAGELVPGDIVSVEAGDRVPADIRLVEASELTTVESALTGESEASEKSVEPVRPGTGLADRHSMLYMGTTVQTGRGRGVVVATGANTEVGKIAALVDETRGGRAPLQEGLERLGRTLSLAVVILAAALIGIGLLRGLDLREVLEVAIALAVAVVPEGLPAVATLTLTVGMRRMAKRKALVRRLPTVETLGSTTVIASDKTGTLTTNVMTVVEVTTAGPATSEDIWESATLANDADIDPDGGGIGDSTEVALLRAADEAGLDWRTARSRSPRQAEDPFDSESKRMAVIIENVVYVKGAPEVLLTERSDPALARAAEDMGNRALRTLAVARRTLASGESPPAGAFPESAYDGLEVLGILGIQDPPRPEAARAVAAVQTAGIRVVMITGDQPATAQAVARQIGLNAGQVLTGRQMASLSAEQLSEAAAVTDVYARVAPDQKLKIVRALQASGNIVAVTGDGVNDAPALRQADVGVAMGASGTEVAREAADIVLLDDNFATIGAAVEEGRRIVANIRHFGQFLFSWHLGIVIVVAVSFIGGFTTPLAGLMILWNNLVIDVIPSFALALEPGKEDAMKDPPRRKDEPILGRGTVRRIISQGLLIAGVGLASYFIALNVLELPIQQAQTTTFVALTAAQLFAVFNARSEHGSGFKGAGRNPFLWYALAVTVALEAVALGFPPLRDILGLTPIPGEAWLVAAILSPLPLICTQTIRILRERARTKPARGQGRLPVS